MDIWGSGSSPFIQTVQPLYPSTQSEIGISKAWLTNTMLNKVCFVAKAELIPNIIENNL